MEGPTSARPVVNVVPFMNIVMTGIVMRSPK